MSWYDDNVFLILIDLSVREYDRWISLKLLFWEFITNQKRIRRRMTETLAKDCNNSKKCLLAALGFQIFLGLFLASKIRLMFHSAVREVLPFNERFYKLCELLCSFTFALDLRTHKQSMTFPSTLLVLGWSITTVTKFCCITMSIRLFAVWIMSHGTGFLTSPKCLFYECILCWNDYLER